MISFTIPGRVSGKGRPKFAVRGGIAMAYTPAKTRNMEAVVRELGAKAMAGAAPIEGPIGLSIVVIQSPAASWSKKKRAAAFWVTGKPDADNVLKLCGDSLNNIVWKDNSQIAFLRMIRRYSLTEPERVEVLVSQLLSNEVPGFLS